MFFTNLQEYSMHKSVIILSILLFGFDVSAGRRTQYSEARRLAALGIDCKDSIAKKKRESFDSARSVKFGLEKYLLKQCKELELQNRQLQQENSVLRSQQGRSKLAVSPQEMSQGESSNPARLSLDSGSSSNGASPLTIIVSSSSSPIAIVRSLAKGKEEDRFTPQASEIILECKSPCGYWATHSPGFSSSSFPGNQSIISRTAPYSDGGCFYP